MTTFCIVNDDLLVERIMAAQWRIILIAPGIHQPVAEALAVRLQDLDRLPITLVLDGDEDVCRIGFGDIAALKRVHQLVNAAESSIRYQPGLRLGALIVDDETFVWAPTPRSVEAMPHRTEHAAPTCQLMPNGLLLDLDAGNQIAWAVGAEGTDVAPQQAEIGQTAIPPDQVAQVEQALADNPPIPVDLQRITRVYSTKLQFVELEVRGANLSRRKLRLPNTLINADAGDELRDMLESGFRPFADFKDRQTSAPIFINGEQAFNSHGAPLEEPVSEARLNRERKDIEAEFLYDVTGFGDLIERERKAEFLKRVEAYKTRLAAHAKGLRQIMQDEMVKVIEQVVKLIHDRGNRMGANIDPERLGAELRKQAALPDDGEPVTRCVFKDVTHEQTRDAEFRQKVDRALPLAVKKRLGQWYDEFNAAKQGGSVTS